MNTLIFILVNIGIVVLCAVAIYSEHKRRTNIKQCTLYNRGRTDGFLACKKRVMNNARHNSKYDAQEVFDDLIQ